MITLQELRPKVYEAATELTHPWKTYDVAAAPRLEGRPHRYGRLVYAEGGNVGGLFDGKYLIARGDDHAESLWALAQKLGLVDFGPTVKVETVNAGWFWLFTNPGGRLPAGQ